MALAWTLCSSRFWSSSDVGLQNMGRAMPLDVTRHSKRSSMMTTCHSRAKSWILQQPSGARVCFGEMKSDPSVCAPAASADSTKKVAVAKLSARPPGRRASSRNRVAVTHQVSAI